MKYLIFILCILLFLSAQSQNYSLKTINRLSGREKIVKEHFSIQAFTKYDTTSMGKYFILDSNTLVVNSDTISIHEIQKMRIKNNFSKGLGLGLAVNGSGCVFGGFALIALSTTITESTFITSSLIAGMGYISLMAGVAIVIPSVLLLVNGARYSAKEFLFIIE